MLGGLLPILMELLLGPILDMLFQFLVQGT